MCVLYACSVCIVKGLCVYLQFTYYNILIGTHVGRLANGRHDFVYDRNTQKSSSYLFLFNRALSVSRSLTSKSWYMTYSTTHIIYIYALCYVLQQKIWSYNSSLINSIRPHVHCGPKIQLWYFFLTTGDCYSTKRLKRIQNNETFKNVKRII